MNMDQHQDMDIRTQLNGCNNPEHGIHGVHVGLSRNSAGWLVYIPSTGLVLVSSDVIFDEDFLSTVSTQSRVPEGLDITFLGHFQQ